MSTMKFTITTISIIGLLLFTGCNSVTKPTEVIPEERESCVDILLDQNLTLDELYIMQDELQVRVQTANEFGDANMERYVQELKCTTDAIKLMEE